MTISTSECRKLLNCINDLRPYVKLNRALKTDARLPVIGEGVPHDSCQKHTLEQNRTCVLETVHKVGRSGSKRSEYFYAILSVLIPGHVLLYWYLDTVRQVIVLTYYGNACIQISNR
jgi:hypothetical protein